jgi:hypothetical protein
MDQAAEDVVTSNSRRRQVGELGHCDVVAVRGFAEGLGFGFWRRSTATSWRSTSSSASFDADERGDGAIHPARRTNIK